MDAAELKGRIRRAFAGVPPPDWCLANSHEGVEPALLAREFRARSNPPS
jgi:hypothetical protein